MNELFILQNQQKLFLGKQNAWVDGLDSSLLYKTAYKDEAINQMVEMSAKDYTQRIKIVSCGVNDKGLPDIDPAILAESLPGAQDMFADQDRVDTAEHAGVEAIDVVVAEVSQG